MPRNFEWELKLKWTKTKDQGEGLVGHTMQGEMK
jgi:hypothetical protein